MNVLPVIDAVVARLKEKLPALQVEYFPEKPSEWGAAGQLYRFALR